MSDGSQNVRNFELSEAAALAESSVAEIRSELEEIETSEMTSDDKAFSDLVDSSAMYGMFRQLERHGVETLALPEDMADDPRTALTEVLTAGEEMLVQEGIASPNLEIYDRAALFAAETGRPLEDVVSEVEAGEPLVARTDLHNQAPSFSAGPSSDTLTADGQLAGFAGAGGSSLQTETLGEDFQATNYQDYDVHLMAYPLARTDLPFGYELHSRDSHAYVVVTEEGGNPYNMDEALLVTRAGPDDGVFGISGSNSSDSSNSNDQSTTDKGSDGDVYVEDHAGSLPDMDDRGNFHLQTITVTGDINDIRSRVAGHRDFINGQDIDYLLLERNSNTYAGDVIELLTGEEPDNPHAGLLGRRTPAMGNDLVDYEETEYAPDFN